MKLQLGTLNRLGVYTVLELSNEDYMKCIELCLARRIYYAQIASIYAEKCMMALILADIVFVDVQHLALHGPSALVTL